MFYHQSLKQKKENIFSSTTMRWRVLFVGKCITVFKEMFEGDRSKTETSMSPDTFFLGSYK